MMEFYLVLRYKVSSLSVNLELELCSTIDVNSGSLGGLSNMTIENCGTSQISKAKFSISTSES